MIFSHSEGFDSYIIENKTGQFQRQDESAIFLTKNLEILFAEHHLKPNDLFNLKN